MEEKKNIKTYLDALVDKQGLRTEVTVTLTDATLMKTALYLIGTVLVSTLIVFGIRSVVLKNEVKNITA
jgi:hypothetical protein